MQQLQLNRFYLYRTVDQKKKKIKKNKRLSDTPTLLHE